MNNPLMQDYAINAPYAAVNPELAATAARLADGKVLAINHTVTDTQCQYLQGLGFEVTAWQHQPGAITTTELPANPIDLDQHRFNGDYSLIFSLGGMMALQASTIPQLIADMQAATCKYGYNLVIAPLAESATELPLQVNFYFRSGELSHYYRRWHIVNYQQTEGELFLPKSSTSIKCIFAILIAQKASLKGL